MLAPVQVLADEDSTGVDEKNNTNVNIEMQGGDLTFDLEKNEGEKSFEAIELEELVGNENGLKKELSPFKKLTIKDARGTKEGYHMTVKADQFEGKNKKNKLDTGVLSIVEPDKEDRTANLGGSDSEVKVMETKGKIIDGGSQKIIEATKGHGAGINTFNFKEKHLIFNLKQQDVIADTYSTTVIFTISGQPDA